MRLGKKEHFNLFCSAKNKLLLHFGSSCFLALLIFVTIQVYTGNWLRHYIPPRERIVTSDSDKLSQVSVSNASRRRLAGSGV